ncbi:hypothetical protein [Flagellimonas oceanensis]|uniref:hypothetical protein n=1 Tax=Flagellimonas oceanensis TaxID=2499163 RepID=UPI000F8C3B1A|nr:hypothetical protein [Allomuricauda oceanensis]
MKLKIVLLYIIFHHFAFSQSPEQAFKILEKSFERMMELQSVAYDSYKEAEESNVTYLNQKDFIYFDLEQLFLAVINFHLVSYVLIINIL